MFPARSLIARFRDAFRGIGEALRSHGSFRLHFPAAAVVIAAAAFFQVTLAEWYLLLLCITAVLTTELFNCAIEHMAKAITREHDENIGYALDMAAAAVMLASIATAVVGMLIFAPYVWKWLA